LFGLTSALRVLPEQQRRALLLREWQGLSYREIADELRLSQAAVETLLFRARRSLAEALTTDPSQRRGPGRPRMASNVGSVAAALKSLLLGGGVKAAATAATVAATSVVAATPAVRQDLVGVMRSDAADRPMPASPVHTSRPAFFLTSPAVVPAPPPVEESRVAPGQAKRSPAAPSPAPPVQTVTVASVIQPTTDPAPAADAAAAPTPAWVPPGQAKRDQSPADGATAAATPA